MATRLFIRQWAGDVSRQMLLLRASSVGTTTTLVDAINLSDPSATLIGRIGWTSSGTSANLGNEIRVSTNDRSATSITFTPALTSATAIGDEIELWNELDQGVTPREVNRLINAGIEAVADSYPVPALDSAQTFDKASPALSIPSAWRWFEGGEYQDSNGLWHTIDGAFDAWRIDEASRTVTLYGEYARKADTLNVRLRGSTRPSALSTDSATTPVDAEYLAYWVAYRICLAVARHSQQGEAWERYASKLSSETETYRPKARIRHTGMGVLLPVAA